MKTLQQCFEENGCLFPLYVYWFKQYLCFIDKKLDGGSIAWKQHNSPDEINTVCISGVWHKRYAEENYYRTVTPLELVLQNVSFPSQKP